MAIHMYKGSLPNYQSSSIAVFNYRTNKLIKKLPVNFSQPPSNLQQHTLLTDPLEKYLIVCDDYGIIVYSIERAFKVHAKFSIPSEHLESPLPYISINQPLTRVRVFNSDELLIAKGSSLLRWNFNQQKVATQVPELLIFPFNQKIADFECDPEKELLFVMLELLFTYEYCEVIAFDLEDMTPVSRYRLNCMFLNRFWGLNIETGSIAILQSDLVKKKSVITFLCLNPDFELEEIKSYQIDGWALPYLISSKEISCLIISQMAGTALKRVWGYFEYAEDSFLTGNESVREGSAQLSLPRYQKCFDYVDQLGCFIGFDGGSLFLCKRRRIIDCEESLPGEPFWEHVRYTSESDA
mgnify:FL=1